MPKTKVVVGTTPAVGTTVAMIVTQAIVIAAIAVPVGLFAVALGMISARGQTGTVRIAVVGGATSPTPTPTQTPSCVRSGTAFGDAEKPAPDCPDPASSDKRACPDALREVLDDIGECASPCSLYLKAPATIVKDCTAWEFTLWWQIALFDVVLFPGGLIYEGGEQIIASNPYNSTCDITVQSRCDTKDPDGAKNGWKPISRP